MEDTSYISVSTPAVALPPMAGEKRLIAGRYQVVGLLQRSRSGDSLLATDLRSGQAVVVRILSVRDRSSAARLRLEQQVDVLRKLARPWIAPVSEVGEDDERLYLVRPYVPGITLRQRLVRSRLDLEDALTVSRNLFDALKEVHAHGILHRDLRPSNVIVADQTPLSGAVLVGFSFGFHPDASDWRDEESIEVVVYRSPEQAGALDYDVGVTADLYSAGIMLFECLAGHPPFDGASVGDVLLQHMTARPAELRSLGIHVPRALDELVQRLLRKDPRDRYQSASAVLADLESITESCGTGNGASLIVGLHDQRPTLTEPALVGRQQELAQLDQQIRHVTAGQAATVLLEAQSGGGKTRLLSELAVRAGEAGMRVLRGQGSDHVGQRPFQVLSGVIEELVVAARGDPSLPANLRSRLGEHLDAACAALPELAKAFGWETSDALGPEAYGETRSIQALSIFLDALGSGRQPALIILDDCQWADEMTVKLITHWHWAWNCSADAHSRVMLVIAFRCEEVPPDHPLRKPCPTLHLRLAPLAVEEIHQLLQSMAGPLPEEAVEVVTRLSEGSPFMASAVLRGMVESGALVAESRGWRIPPSALADLQSSTRAAGFLSRRIELLPQDTINLLTFGAVLGKEFELHLAAELAGLAPARADEVLETARHRHFVWCRPNGTECVFVHDKLRAALLDRITPQRRRELHDRVARYLERTTPDRIFDLAYHFDAAGASARALPYAAAAARRARSQHALEVAEQQYRIAQRGEAATDKSTKYRIREGLGEVLMLRGRYREAKQPLEAAAAIAEGDFARAQIKGKLGELAFKQGDMECAVSAFEEALRLLGYRLMPPPALLCPLLALWEAWVQLLHTLLPRWFVGRRRQQPPEAELLRLRLLSLLAYAYWFSRGRAQNFWVHLNSMNIAERYSPTSELAQIYSEHAVAMTLLGWYRRGIAYAEKSLEIRRSRGDLWGQGQSLSFYGVVLYAASRFAECIDKCREGVRLLERTGDYWEMHIAGYQVAASLYRLGDMRGAVEEARRIHESGLEMGDEQASGITLDIWALATEGHVPDEILQRELRRKRPDAQGMAQVLLACGVQFSAAGRHEEAVAAFHGALEQGKRLGIFSAYIAPNLAWLATALRRQAQAQARLTPARRTELLRQAERAARRAVRVGRRLQNDLPHALRELALVRAMQGRTREVRALLRESLAVAQRQGARYEIAQTRRISGQLGLELGWPGAQQDLHDAEALSRELLILQQDPSEGQKTTAPVTLSLADRFDTVLDAGRKIASALSPEAIFDQAREAALRLLRGEQCLVLEVVAQGGEPRFNPVRRSEHGAASTAILLRAVAEGQAIVGIEEASGNTSDSAASTGEHSALCVPILVRGRTAACLYVTHQHVRGLFGRDEQRLADFIATLAGAALENAEGFNELERLNETLEVRVAERTAAAESRAMELASSNRELARIAHELRQTEEQLRLAIDAAETANRAKSRFLATMSHEIRTPLNGVLGMTELALRTPLTLQQQNYLTTVRQSARSLLEILNDVLDVSKIEAGRMELEQIPFTVREVAEDAAVLFAVPASQNGLEIICRVARDVPRQIVGDPVRLRQILINLVGNALKFTRQGEIFLDVCVESRSDADPVLHFAVRDTGIGIPADKQQCIFEAFRQSDSSTTRRFGGTGLGLAISAQLVGLMGGRIWVDSQPGLGSTFHFNMPYRLPESPAPPFSVPAGLDRVPVLVMSSQETARRMYCQLLADWGMLPQPADNAQAALGALAPEKQGASFRLVLCDVGLADAEGWTLIERLANNARLSDCRIVALLAPAQADAPERCREYGVEHYLARPPKQEQLLAAVVAALGLQQAPRGRTAEVVSAPARTLRILLAEDNLVNQEVAVGLLELRGHQVHVVNNGQEALDAWAQQPFDLVFMDIEMPEMDGLQATTALRRQEAAAGGHIPVIAMTAHAIKNVLDQCLAAGMDGCICKPIQPAELFQAVESATGLRQTDIPQTRPGT